MKIHEIQWIQGKQYKDSIFGIVWTVVQDERALMDEKTSKYIEDMVFLREVIDAEFTEV